MTTRRDFLATTTAATVAAATPATATATELYDFGAIDARLQRTARHRQVFAVARVADGVVVGQMNHSLDAYETAMGEGKGTLHAAAVFYSRGAILGLNDRTWRTYRLAEAARRRADVLVDTTTDTNPWSSDFARLSERGATFFVCDNALAEWSTYLVTSMGFNALAPEQVHAELRQSLVAGALLVPAGVAALNAAQEARFTFVQASL